MSIKFTEGCQPPHPDLTIRDYFAAKAMQGFCSNVGIVFESSPSDLDIARYSYNMADAMLKERLLSKY